MTAAGLSEHEVGGFSVGPLVDDVIDMLQARYPASSALEELVYDLSLDILDSKFSRYFEVVVDTTPGASSPVTARFLWDDFRDDLANAADKLLT